MNPRPPRGSRPFPYNAEPSEPQEAKSTTWHNPTSKEQKVVVHEDGRRVMYPVPAHGDKEIPSRHDLAIHRVQCKDEGCRAGGKGFCLLGHPGVVQGGIAPQLVRVGPRPEGEHDELAKGLDTEGEIRDQIEMAKVAADQRRREAEVDSMLTARRSDELREIAAGGPAKRPAQQAAGK